MFKMRKDARAFFSRIEDSFSRQAPYFDMYYFCLMAGLALKRRAPSLAEAVTTDLTDGFPGEFTGRAEILISHMLAVEMERLGVDLRERVVLNREIGKLIDPRTPSYLSSDGIYAMNAYSCAGCDVLRQEWFDEPPSSLDYFLVTFKTRIDELSLANDVAAAT